MQERLRLSILQMTSATRHEANIETVAVATELAAKDGAEMLALPEVAGLMNRNAEEARKVIGPAADDPFIAACQALAEQHGLWIQMGSTPVLAPDGRFLNHGALIDNQGAIRAEYDKIHLFDVALEGQKPIGESRRFAPGETAMLVETPWGGLGLTICYDLRFPQLYRDLAQAGAHVLFVPSSFTVPTGEAHWETLLRARAIENGCWVVAAAQVGHHEDGRDTYGHSLVIDPWGEIVADLGGDAPEQRTLDLDLTRVKAVREQIPSLRNRRYYALKVIPNNRD